MIISFDLDDTLFINPDICDAEKPLKFPLNLIFRDRLRYGTISLLSELKNRNIKVWIYTTSFRSEWYIKTLFKCYGINIDYIVNGERHKKKFRKTNLNLCRQNIPPDTEYHCMSMMIYPFRKTVKYTALRFILFPEIIRTGAAKLFNIYRKSAKNCENLQILEIHATIQKKVFTYYIGIFI